MNPRNLALALPSALALSITFAGTAAADDPKPDTAGNLTIYDNAGKTAVFVMGCPNGRLGPEWPTCVKTAKARQVVLDAVCKAGVGKVIAGKTYFKYRMGTIKTLLPESVDCTGARSSPSTDAAATSTDTDASVDASADTDTSDFDIDRGASKLTGTRSSAAAYWLDGKLIVFDACGKKRSSYDYVDCGKTVRARAEERICALRTRGTHRYYYRLGTSRAMKLSAYCK